MGYLILIGIIIFLGLMAFAGYHRGFLRIVLSFVAVALSLVISYLITPLIVKAIQPTDFYQNVRQPIYNFMKDEIRHLESVEVGELEDIVLESQTVSDLLENLGLPQSIVKSVEDSVFDSELAHLTGETVANTAADGLTEWIFYAGIFVLCFIIVMLILRLIIGLCDIVSKLPVLNTFNRSLGLLLGLAEGVLILWVLCLILMATAATAPGREMMEAVTDNPITNFIYVHNPLLYLLNR